MLESLEQFLVPLPGARAVPRDRAGYWNRQLKFGEFSGRDRNVEEVLVLDLVPARSDVGRIRTRSGASC
jgi:hypothetical protein